MVSWLAAQMVDLTAVMSAGRWESRMGYLRAETRAEKMAGVKVRWKVFVLVVVRVGMTVVGMVDWKVAS